MMRGLAILLFALSGNSAFAQMRTIVDFKAAMDKSDVNYQIDQLTPEHEREAAALMWPEGHASGCPELRVVNGRKSVGECADVAPAAKDAFAEGEKLFFAKNWDAARKKYEEAKRLSPSSWLLDLHIGDCLLYSSRFVEALESYDRAIKANPLHYRGHLFRAHALIKLRRFDDARESLIDALVLRPRNPTAMSFAHAEASRLGVVPYEQAFEPRAIVQRIDAKHIRVETVPSAHWMAFAMCEAFWFGEEKPKKPGWSSEEGHECMANLIATYASRRAERDQTVPPEPQLDRLSDIALHSHLLDQFVIYEIGSRMMPDLPLILDDGVRAKLRSYVAQYVLPRSARH